jgi:hypothetical protein
MAIRNPKPDASDWRISRARTGIATWKFIPNVATSPRTTIASRTGGVRRTYRIPSRNWAKTSWRFSGLAAPTGVRSSASRIAASPASTAR